MGEMRILSPNRGDDHIAWDTYDTKATDKARKRFEKHVNAGGKAYRVERAPTRTGDPVETFDPRAEEYLLVPALSGG